jgi:hypothetical protein
VNIGETTTEEIDQFEFFNKKNEKLNCIHAQGNKLYFWRENELYKISLEELLQAEGT